jgi:hypothetical protein
MSGPEPDAVTDTCPWEEPGRWRRDGLPHRGGLLAGLGELAAVSAIFGWGLCAPGLVGLGLGLLVWLLARRDLRLMALGVMDPEGRELTRRAAEMGFVSAVFGLIPSLVLCGFAWCYLLDRIGVSPPPWW